MLAKEVLKTPSIGVSLPKNIKCPVPEYGGDWVRVTPISPTKLKKLCFLAAFRTAIVNGVGEIPATIFIIGSIGAPRK